MKQLVFHEARKVQNRISCSIQLCTCDAEVLDSITGASVRLLSESTVFGSVDGFSSVASGVVGDRPDFDGFTVSFVIGCKDGPTLTKELGATDATGRPLGLIT